MGLASCHGLESNFLSGILIPTFTCYICCPAFFHLVSGGNELTAIGRFSFLLLITGIKSFILFLFSENYEGSNAFLWVGLSFFVIILMGFTAYFLSRRKRMNQITRVSCLLLFFLEHLCFLYSARSLKLALILALSIFFIILRWFYNFENIFKFIHVARI